MAAHADVRSLEQIDVLLQHMVHFRHELVHELENLELEIRKLTQWIEQEAHGYWREQLVRAQRHTKECQSALTRCISAVRQSERRPCTEERKRLNRAEQRQRLCEQKQQWAKVAIREWETTSRKLQSKAAKCRDLADAELPTGIAHLRGQLEQLQRYAQLRSEGNATSIPDGTATEAPAAVRDQPAVQPADQPPRRPPIEESP